MPAPAAGRLEQIVVKDGETVGVGALLGMLAEGAVGKAAPISAGPEVPQPRAEPKPAAQVALPKADADEEEEDQPASGSVMPPAPAARKLMAESGLSSAQVDGSGKRGQILKSDVLTALERPAKPAPAAPPVVVRAPAAPGEEAREQRVAMTRLRQTIARRLKEAQNTAAMLTTFNDVDMSAVMEMRKTYREVFEKKHGVRLGFMGFFVKAVVQALKDIPAVNAEIDGSDIVFKNYYHVGVAVGIEKGLVVPVIRNAEDLSIAGIEKAINDFAKRARDGKLAIEEMQGGTFTITNGGVYGSLMSTPILNAPQSGILGMHRIDERPVARNGAVVIRPMMYLALSYDHRIVDGREAVTFLVRVKEAIEDPQRLVLDL